MVYHRRGQLEAKNLAGDNGRGASGAGGWLREQFLVLWFYRGERGGAEGEVKGGQSCRVAGRTSCLRSDLHGGRERMGERLNCV